MHAGQAVSVQTGQIRSHPFGWLEYGALDEHENRLFDQIRQAVPIVDASINKIIRLVGDFTVECSNQEAQRELDEFCKGVRVGPSSMGLAQFLYGYLDNLMTYGNAAGEMIPTVEEDSVGALYNVPLESLLVKRGENPLQIQFYSYPDGMTPELLPHPERAHSPPKTHPKVPQAAYASYTTGPTPRS